MLPAALERCEHPVRFAVVFENGARGLHHIAVPDVTDHASSRAGSDHGAVSVRLVQRVFGVEVEVFRAGCPSDGDERGCGVGEPGRRGDPERDVELCQPGPQRLQIPAQEAKPSLWQDVREGFAYIWHWPGMFMLLSLAVLLNFTINPGMTLLPLLVTKHFKGEALQLGWINSAWGVGLILGGVLLSAWGGFRKRIVTSLVGILGMGTGFVVIGLAPSTAFWLALVA